MLNVQIFHITSRFCNFLNCYLAHADLAADLAVAVADLAHLAVAVAVADLAVAVAVADLAHLAVAVAVADLAHLAVAVEVADLAHHSLDLAHLAVAADLGYLAFAVIGGFAHGLFQDLRKIKISFNKIPKITSLSHPFSLFKIKY
jgi:hypothetical protein